MAGLEGGAPFLCGVRIDLAGQDREAYPFCLPVVQRLRELELRAPVTVLAGENGSGKSTLLEAIAVVCGFNPEGGGRNFRFSTAPTHSPLCRAMTVSRRRRERDGFFLRTESFYNVASEVDRLERESPGPSLLEYYGGRSLHEQSHGESFLALARHRFRGQGLYLLDEPESALSPTRQLSLIVILHELVERGAQFLMATHSPILMGYPGADILVIGADGALERTRYEQTEHVAVMKEFLLHRQKMLDMLFS